MYKKVKISHGDGGWGGPLIINPPCSSKDR